MTMGSVAIERWASFRYVLSDWKVTVVSVTGSLCNEEEIRSVGNVEVMIVPSK